MTDFDGTGSLRQSYAGAVRQRLFYIERQIMYGVRHEALRQELADQGHCANLGTFRTSLARARAWWKLRAQELQEQSRLQEAFMAAHTTVDAQGAADSGPLHAGAQLPWPARAPCARRQQPVQNRPPWHSRHKRPLPPSR